MRATVRSIAALCFMTALAACSDNSPGTITQPVEDPVLTPVPTQPLTPQNDPVVVVVPDPVPAPGPVPTPAPPPDDGDDHFNAGLEIPPSTAPADGTPSVPANLRVDLIGNDWVELNWAPSVDDGRVVEYRLARNDGVVYTIREDQTDIASGSQDEIDKIWATTSFIDCNYTRFDLRLHQCGINRPTTGAAYSYQISAVDDDGNESAQSEPPLFVQLYEDAGSPVVPYSDSYLDGDDTFPFETDFSSRDNFLSMFELVFQDEFNGDALDTSKWNTVLTWGHNDINGELQYFVDTEADPDFGYDPFVMTGTDLSIEAIETPAELLDAALGHDYLSGALSNHDKFGFTFGYTEARIKVSGTPGAISSFHLFRRWEAAQSPEIDIVEYLGENPYGAEHAFQTYHFKDVSYDVTRSSPTMSVANPTGDLFSDDYHVYGALWEPGLVVWYIDGKEVKRLSGPQIGRQNMNIVLYLVSGSGWAPRPASADFPLKMAIDYVRVYQRAPFIK